MSANHGLFKDRDSQLVSDCSTSSSLGSRSQQTLHRREVQAEVEEQWDQDSMDTSDVGANTSGPFFIHGGAVLGSVFLSLSPPTSVQYRAGLPAQHPDDLDVVPSPKKHKRPSKEKRLRFQQLVDDLKVRVRQELENFNVDDIPLPKCLADDPKTVAHMKSMMGNYRDQILAGVEVPDLDAKQFNTMAPQDPKVTLPFNFVLSL